MDDNELILLCLLAAGLIAGTVIAALLFLFIGV